jgi:hypothetical protein
MGALQGLAVSCKFVDDAALATLPDFPALKELMPMDVSDDGFRHVGRCRQLESLILMYCRDTGDEATNHLGGLSNLKKYHAGYTLMTDRSLELLGQMNSLEELSFEGCKFITDAGIPFLTNLPRLREISIGGCPSNALRRDFFCNSVAVNYDAHWLTRLVAFRSESASSACGPERGDKVSLTLKTNSPHGEGPSAIAPITPI